MAQQPLTKLGKKGKSKTAKLDTTQKSDIKEKPYVVKAVDSSIAILESVEDDIVLEALLHLSKYVDTQMKDLNFLQQRTLLQKLLNLFNRNICILRLVLRLLGILLTVDDIMADMDQDIHDDKILKISNMYISHTDPLVRQFCVSILSKLAESGRIVCLIFKIDLINPILDTIQKTKDVLLLEGTVELFLKLLNAPAALGILPEMYNFDISILLMHLENSEKKIAFLSYEVIHKLTDYSLDVFQKMFREAKLIENMLEVVMNPEKQVFHEIAFDIICDCMKSEETSNYFIETVEFLKFCHWVKSCNVDYLYPSIVILEQLTRLPSRRQILFDLSVEESIMYCLRSTEKHILNKTCEAMSNMSTHRYCVERMLTPIVLKELCVMLLRKDEEDPGNEVAMKTLLDFSRRNLKTIGMLHAYGGHKVLLNYFRRGIATKEESILAILEILYKMAVHPLYQQEIIDVHFVGKLLHLFQTSTAKIAAFVSEILINFIGWANFRHHFMSANGTQIFVGAVQTSKNVHLLRNVFLFIHSCLIHETMVNSFLHNNLVRVLRETPVYAKLPFAKYILKHMYNFHLPMKFFENRRLDITDKIPNKFYLIDGQWKGPFPFLEILEATQVSTFYTIYVVDYTFEVINNLDAHSVTTELLGGSSTSDWSLVTTISKVFTDTCQINYGRLSSDIYLPRYIYHIGKYFEEVNSIKQKFKLLADFVDSLLCGPKKGCTKEEKMNIFKQHRKALRYKLGTNLIPIGYLRIGFHCERALLFKAVADKCNMPSTLVKGRQKIFWNEVALPDPYCKDDTLALFVVDLMDNIGDLLMVGTRAANRYCGIHT
ncbi:uncharacterized protein LOC108903477 [Anoplophora glabripennis]|uniref:uncharacterized protein LOC108903477 n=1 Tax=Anoplophora glabripennis TaxID=217634 RepID=UPI0008741219|nr:uncharacterized protein LOC108903477 [Anoplophora glabripennis]